MSAHFAAIRELAGRSRVVAIGETGLDFHYDHSPHERQLEEFRRFVGLAASSRYRSSCTVARQKRKRSRASRGERHERGHALLHVRSGGGEAVSRLGLYISFSGIVTFRNAGDLREAARLVPSDRLLIETDSPYLAPEPRRAVETSRNASSTSPEARAAVGRPLEEIAEERRREHSAAFAIR